MQKMKKRRRKRKRKKKAADAGLQEAMNEVTENQVITDLLKRGYRQIFEEQWPIMTGGIMIGILSIVTFA